jgi:tyrosine-specific transport protein
MSLIDALFCMNVCTLVSGFVVGLRDFIEDALLSVGGSLSVNKGTISDRGLLTFALVLLPPLAFALVNPTIFFGALDIAGSLGISVLFGILPAVMAWKQRDALGSSGGENGRAYAPKSGARTVFANEGFRMEPLLSGGRPVLVLIVAVASALVARKLTDLAHVGFGFGM